MANTNKMNKYKKRQLILICCLAVVLIAVIIFAAFWLGNDSKNIVGENSSNISDSSDLQSLADSSSSPADKPAGGDPENDVTITADPSELTLKPGESTHISLTFSPEDAQTDVSWESSDSSVATVNNDGTVIAIGEGSCKVTVSSTVYDGVSAEISVTVDGGTADIQEVDGITYINGILVVNKSYSLPSDYAPGLSSEAESAFNEMAADAAKEGLNIYISSGYRSYDYQKQIYSNYSGIYGSETADTFSARPGYSEHQSGLAIDMNSIDDSFAGTPESDWVDANCYKYGFILRYPKGKEDITGYKYESWHVRYLGIENATAVFNSGLTLEEYLGIDSKYDE